MFIKYTWKFFTWLHTLTPAAASAAHWAAPSQANQLHSAAMTYLCSVCVCVYTPLLHPVLHLWATAAPLIYTRPAFMCVFCSDVCLLFSRFSRSCLPQSDIWRRAAIWPCFAVLQSQAAANRSVMLRFGWLTACTNHHSSLTRAAACRCDVYSV